MKIYKTYRHLKTKSKYLVTTLLAFSLDLVIVHLTFRLPIGFFAQDRAEVDQKYEEVMVDLRSKIEEVLNRKESDGIER